MVFLQKKNNSSCNSFRISKDSKYPKQSKKKKVDDAVILLLHICPEELKTGFKQTLVYQSSQLHYSPQAKGEKHLVSSDM
jgi:hypothetical protein